MSDLGLDHTANGECINVISDRDILIFAANNCDATINKNDTQTVHIDRKITVNGKLDETIKGDTTIKVTAGNLNHDVVAGTADYHVTGVVTEKFDATQSTTVKGNIGITSSTGEITITAATKITLVTGDSKIVMGSGGDITITAKTVTIIGSTEVKVSGDSVSVSGTKDAKFGTGSQNIATDVALTAISGAAINSSATGKHEITGAVVKIN